MTVAIKKTGNNIVKAVSDVMDLGNYKEYIPKNSDIFLKVNLGWDLFIPGSITNPAVFEGVAKKLTGYAKNLYVIESDQVLENVEKAFYKSKFCEIANYLNIKWINLSKCEKTVLSMPENKILKNITIPKLLNDAIIVTVPVMKTHDKTTVTISLKNQWGCIPKMRHMYHLHLTEAISDVNAALKVRFSVVDGTIALEGNGPKTGKPREMGIVAAGGDIVEVDSVCAKIMGFNPQSIQHLIEAKSRNLGVISCSYIGDRLEPTKPFTPAKHNIVSKIELFFRKSKMSDLIFKTPLFHLMLIGAKIYYIIFDIFKGKKLRKYYQNHEIYGEYFAKPKL